MLTDANSTAGYEIQSAANLMLINFFNTSENWRISELVTEVRERLGQNRNLDLILNLEEVTNADGPILKAVWQLSRLFRISGHSTKCVLPQESSAPALELLAANGVIDIYQSVESIIYAEDSAETWDVRLEDETLAW